MDAIFLSSLVDSLFNHAEVLVLWERAGGVEDLPTRTSSLDSRSAGNTEGSIYITSK